MKYQIFMIALMVLSVFAIANVSAVNLDNVRIKAQVQHESEISADDLESDDSAQIASSLSSVDASAGVDAKAITFAQLHRGVGWATSGDEGKLVAILWVEKEFTNNNSEEKRRAEGFLKLDSMRAYKLSLDSSTDSSIRFKVGPPNNSVGTLTLDSQSNLTDFTSWTGTLVINNETYNINVATRDGKIRSDGKMPDMSDSKKNDSDNETRLRGNANAEVNGKGKKIGLFSRISNFFRRG